MRTNLIRRFAVAALVALCAACATHRTSGPRPSRDVLTQQEMLDGHFITVAQAISALRSNWLNVHPNTLMGTQEDVVIYYDSNRLGGPGELGNINVRDIRYVQHLDAVTATQRYGVGHSQGAILVSSHD